MFKGTVSFRARIIGHGLKFPLCEFKPPEPSVDKIGVESKDGHEILSTVHLSSIPTREEGIAMATTLNTATLDRITFFYDSAIEGGQITGAQFSPVNPPPGQGLGVEVGDYLHLGESINLIRGISAACLKDVLEKVSPPGEQRFGLFRSARQSMSHVEEFVHLYNLILLLCGDDQGKVDAFIRGAEPTVPQTQHPLKAHGVMETIYSRLRNELAHPRTGGDLDTIKGEMVTRLDGLRALTKQAIEVRP